MSQRVYGCILATILLQTGCAPTMTTSLDQIPAEELPVGSTFFLNHDLNMTPGFINVGLPSVPIQDGRIVRRFALELFEPYCEFILNVRAQGETYVESDSFVVDSVTHSRNFMRWDAQPRLYAAGPGFRLAESESGSPGYNVIVIDYSLSSEFQGEGYTLRCREVFDAASGRSFTLGQLRDTLGTLFSVQPAFDRSLEVQ